MYYVFIYFDVLKSIIKAIIFGICISIISCVWGITTEGGSFDIGNATTSSVVICLIFVFLLNFILSYFMFDNFSSAFQFL